MFCCRAPLFRDSSVLADRGRKFDAEEAFALMARHGVRNAFLPPTALKMMRQIPKPRERFGHRPRSVASGGEPLRAGESGIIAV
jgi:acetyl-CoA synthetase